MAANCLKVEEEDLKPGAKSNWFGECTDCLLGISELCCWCQSVSQNRGVRRRGHLGCQRLASREGCLFHESRLAKLELREAVRALRVSVAVRGSTRPPCQTSQRLIVFLTTLKCTARTSVDKRQSLTSKKPGWDVSQGSAGAMYEAVVGGHG